MITNKISLPMSPQHLHKLAGVNHFHASHIPQFVGYIEPTCFVYKSLKSWTMFNPG